MDRFEPFLELPRDVIFSEIVAKISPSTKASFSLVSKQFRLIVNKKLYSNFKSRFSIDTMNLRMASRAAVLLSMTIENGEFHLFRFFVDVLNLKDELYFLEKQYIIAQLL